MNNRDILFEIKEVRTRAGSRANLVMLEGGEQGKAYLGFCEELQPVIDGTVRELAGGELLVLLGATIGIIYRNGHPLAAPKNWKKLVIKSLEVQDPLVVVIEETSAVVVEDALSFANL